MNRIQFKKFSDWFFNQTETYERAENGELVPVRTEFYRLKPQDRCIRECGSGRFYQFASWKYFTKYGNKNFVINGNYIGDYILYKVAVNPLLYSEIFR